MTPRATQPALIIKHTAPEDALTTALFGSIFSVETHIFAREVSMKNSEILRLSYATVNGIHLINPEKRDLFRDRCEHEEFSGFFVAPFLQKVCEKGNFADAWKEMFMKNGQMTIGNDVADTTADIVDDFINSKIRVSFRMWWNREIGKEYRPSADHLFCHGAKLKL